MTRRHLLIALVPVLVACAGAGSVMAQNQGGGSQADRAARITAVVDSLQQEGVTALQMTEILREMGLTGVQTSEDDSGGTFFRSFTNDPKAGTKASVRQYSYYWEILSEVKMRNAATSPRGMPSKPRPT